MRNSIAAIQGHMTPSLNSTFWHDGQLNRVTFEMDSGGNAQVTLLLALYESEHAPKRTAIAVVCKRVSQFKTTMDVAELKDNARAGNIADGRVENGLLTLELTGGIVEIEAKEFRVDAV